MTMTERIADYEIISEEVSNGVKRAVLRNSKGVTAVCNIPIHTAEEEQMIIDRFCFAAAPIVCPNADVSKIKSVEIVKECKRCGYSTEKHS